MLRAIVALTVAALPALTPLTANADGGVRVVAADGRVLGVGSVVETGSRSGDDCTFQSEGVTMLADVGVPSGVVLATDDSCRLVVSAISAEAPLASAALTQSTPKVYDTTSASPAAAGAPVGASAANAAVDSVGTAASTQTVDVQATQIVYDEAGVQEYRDTISAQYTRNRRSRTVGGVAMYDGACERSWLDENVVFTPYANEVLSCFFKPIENGPAEIAFVGGGTYRKAVAGVEIDRRKLTETFAATYTSITARWCSTGGSLPVGWSSFCYFDVN